MVFLAGRLNLDLVWIYIVHTLQRVPCPMQGFILSCDRYVNVLNEYWGPVDNYEDIELFRKGNIFPYLANAFGGYKMHIR